MIPALTVELVVINYGKANGYDGLCNDGLECGCTWDDIAPCMDMNADCELAYRFEEHDERTGENWYMCTNKSGKQQDETL